MSTKPKRIQRKRTKGWRMPEGAVYVGRPSKWGNPHPWAEYVEYYPEHADDPAELRRMASSDFQGLTEGKWGDEIDYPSVAEVRDALAGRDLACWCPLDQPCHADVLLEIANGGEPA